MDVQLCISVSLFLTMAAFIASVDSSTNYVLPTDGNSTLCQQNPIIQCLTFNQYTNNQDQYFHSNTIFVFLPGNHHLNTSLRLSDVQHMSFHGELTSAGESVTVFLDPNMSLGWTNCDQIEIHSLSFISIGNFEYRLIFVNVQDVSLNNTSIIGNRPGNGCSAIAIQSSKISIADSIFAGIRGQLGAVLALNSSQVIFNGINTLSNNMAKLGGAVFSINSSIQMFGTMNLMNNTATMNLESDTNFNCNYSYQDMEIGGAIFADSSNVTINSCAAFVNNSAKFFGGALATVNNSTFIVDDSLCDCSETTDIKEHNNIIVFDRNKVTATTSLSGSAFNDINVHDSSFGSGGAIYTENSAVNISNAVFIDNYSPGSGGAVQFNYSDISIQYVTMLNNSGFFAGAMRVIYSKFVAGGVNFFEYNRARNEYGGAILIDFCENAQIGGTNYFTGNIAVDYGGGLDIFAVQPLIVSGTNFFRDNKAAYGSAVGMYNSTVLFTGDSIYENNAALIYGGAFSIEASVSVFDSNNSVIFRNNTAASSGGAITSYDSQIKLHGNTQFDSNSAELGVGGAMALYGTTKLTLTPLITVDFVRNRAKSFGGAIYFADSISSGQCSINAKPADCFLVLNTSYSKLNTSQIALNFINNVADEDGSVLYGGQFDRCALLFGEVSQSDSGSECTCTNTTNSALEYSRDSFAILSGISMVEYDENSTTVFSSPAERICICNGSSIITCESESLVITKEIMPGQKFTVAMVALGQGNSIVQGTVLSKNVNSNAQYRLSPTIQSTSSLTCIDVDYRLYVTDSEINDNFVYYKLFLDGPCQSLADGVEIYLDIQPCPVGFTLNSEEGECVCEKMLQPLTQDCYIDSQSILRPSNNFWMALQQTANSTDNGFVLHNGSCPLDYCVDDPINITLGDPNVQCHKGRVGTLCGTCKENFSLVLGSLNCLPCSNAYLALLIPFALSGIVVVVVLFLLHLTVAAGMINGLIFYANIIQANYQAFFPRSTINFFTVFIAWLNFDFGIETCLYDGLTIYAYSWLEFLFPLYLWVIIIIIIIGCHYSQRISNSLGHNPVAVLDTILLMSYSKILKAIIVPLSPASLTYFPGASIEKVWLYDASISYFQEPHHIILGIFAIFTLLFLFLPYTFLLLCGHWLQAKSHWRLLSWINKLKPFMDAYHAPYRKNKRHWIGIYLLARCGLFVTFAFNAVGDYDINLLAVCSVVAGLSIIKGRVYEKRYNDFLESSFLLNLCIFSVATFYVSEEMTGDRQSRIQNILSGISVGIAFVYFIGILVFHVCQRLEGVDLFGSIRFFRKFSDKETADDKTTEVITNSSINLRELLLDDSHE